MSRVNILGYGVDLYTFDEALDYIVSKRGQIVTINPEMIEYAQKDKNFSQIIHNAELVLPDGVGVEIGLRVLGHNVKKIPGIDFGKALIVKFSKENKRIAMIGGKPNVVDKAIANLEKDVEGMNIVYSHDGYFADDDVVMSEIINSNPDLILVALGSPKQEFFINKLKSSLPNSVMIGLGGSFDVWAGIVNRAPAVFQKLCLEWLYRSIKEPKRFKRIFPTLPLFMLKVFKERLYK